MSSDRKRAAKARRRERAKRSDKARRQSADRCAILLYDATAALDAGELASARQLLEHILRIRPTHHAANELLSDLHFRAGRYELCLAHYECLTQPPRWLPLMYEAAVASAFVGLHDQSVTLARQFLRFVPDSDEWKRLRSAAKTLERDELAAARRVGRPTPLGAAPPARSATPLFDRVDPQTRERGKARGKPASASAPRVGDERDPREVTAAREPLAPALPPFPEPATPDISIEFEVDRGGLPDRLAPDGIRPAAEVGLQRAYAALRLQKGFDELLSLGAIQGVEHFRYQLDSVRRILRDFRGRVLLADEVGLGKTIEACLALKEYWLRGLVRKVLILTPPSLVGQWVEELGERFNLPAQTPDSPGFRRDHEDSWRRAPIVVASLSLVRQPAYRERLRGIDYDLVIVDEAHALKRRTGAAWQLVNDLKKRFLLLLSATPVGNNLAELYNLILLLKPGLLQSEAQFRREYGMISSLAHAGRREKLRLLLREVMLRNTRAHIDLKLPRRIAATHVVQPSGAEADVIGALAAVIRNRYPAATASDRWRLVTLQMQAGSSPAALRFGLRDREGPPSVDAGAFGPILTALDRVGRPAKTAALLELARRSDDKKIVFTRFRATLDELERDLTEAGHRVAVFHGGLTPAEKSAAIAGFQHDAEILLSSEIGGEGQNLQFCRTVINFDLPWNPMAIEQRVGRVHRIGQTRDVYVFNFCLAGSIEERILRILHDKINLFELVAGEIEMILGHLDDDQDFASLVMDAWARSRDQAEEDRVFGDLSEVILRAKSQYDRTVDLDRALFSVDYEV